MTTCATIPLTDDIVTALAKFFHGGAGPSHSEISWALTGTGYSDDYPYRPGVQGPNKEHRILQCLSQARRQPARAKELFDAVLSTLRTSGLIGASSTGEDVDRLKRALASTGWYLT